MAAMKTLTVCLLVVAAFAAVTALGEEEVVQAGNACGRRNRCAGNQCCSRYGYCGLGGDYCGAGCKSGPCYAVADEVVPEEEVVLAGNACGRRNRCAGNQCCSRYGYCGLGGDYCGAGCKSGPCYALANEVVPEEEAAVQGNACGRRKRCSGNMCCSRYGYCGLGGDYCGAGCKSGPCYRVADDLSGQMI